MERCSLAVSEDERKSPAGGRGWVVFYGLLAVFPAITELGFTLGSMLAPGFPAAGWPLISFRRIAVADLRAQGLIFARGSGLGRDLNVNVILGYA
jgi:hypothetical protein